MRRFLLAGLLLLAGSGIAAAQALTVHGLGQGPSIFDVAALERLGTVEITDAREVSGPTGTGRREIVYRGVELVALLEALGIERIDRHAVRAATVLVTAKDGYRVTFSWGELFNSPIGRRVLVVTGENGRPNPERQGPFALRSLADTRPGPRAVRDVADIRVQLP